MDIEIIYKVKPDAAGQAAVESGLQKTTQALAKNTEAVKKTDAESAKFLDTITQLGAQVPGLGTAVSAAVNPIGALSLGLGLAVKMGYDYVESVNAAALATQAFTPEVKKFDAIGVAMSEARSHAAAFNSSLIDQKENFSNVTAAINAQIEALGQAKQAEDRLADAKLTADEAEVNEKFRAGKISRPQQIAQLKALRTKADQDSTARDLKLIGDTRSKKNNELAAMDLEANTATAHLPELKENLKKAVANQAADANYNADPATVATRTEKAETLKNQRSILEDIKGGTYQRFSPDEEDADYRSLGLRRLPFQDRISPPTPEAVDAMLAQVKRAQAAQTRSEKNSVPAQAKANADAVANAQSALARAEGNIKAVQPGGPRDALVRGIAGLDSQAKTITETRPKIFAEQERGLNANQRGADAADERQRKEAAEREEKQKQEEKARRFQQGFSGGASLDLSADPGLADAGAAVGELKAAVLGAIKNLTDQIRSTAQDVADATSRERNGRV